MRIDFHNLPYADPYEYWCNNCGTMNLSFVSLDVCGECKSTDIVRGKPFELDLEQLKEQYAQRQHKP